MSANGKAQLSERETQVSSRYIDGLSYKEIARDLGISPGTVRTHLNAIYRKLEVTNRIALLQKLAAESEPVADAPPQESEPAESGEVAETHAPEPVLERRQLTVLFVDLVGSTELSMALDAEDMHALLDDYRTTVRRQLAHFGGHAAGFPGDGVVASFGWPNALEDAAERAICAGLAIAASVGEMAGPDGRPLAARVGIATGMVVVDGRSGRAESLTGATPNLAARLQALAEPGCVTIAASTHDLAGRLFDLTPLGEQSIKGLSGPVNVYRVDGQRRSVSRFDALHETALLPMHGRDQELALLTERWSRAMDGEGQAVLLAGEPGIGKSRIAAALIEAVGREGVTVLHYQTAPQQVDSSLWPVRQQIALAAQLADEMPVADKVRNLRQALRQGGQAEGTALALIAGMLNIEAGDPLPPMSAERRRMLLLEVLIDQLAGQAAKAPVLVMFEDLHWIDPTSLALVERMLAAIEDRRIMLLMTTRPDDEPSLPNHAHLTRVTLSRLAKSAVEAIVAMRTAGAALDPDLVETILARTDGVPLYVEEMTAAIQEAGIAAESVPASLQDSLMARLDRLGEAKETAQLASVIGREFDLELMAKIVGDPSVLEAAIERLVSSGLVLGRGRGYIFKHALVQDAAYQSLLRSRRSELHGQIANALLGGSRQRVASEPALLAHHLERAGRTEAAIDYYMRAADMDNHRAANREAQRHLQQALSLIDTLPAGRKRDRRDVAAHTLSGRINAAVFGHASDTTAQIYRRALVRCHEAGLGLEEFPIVVGLTIQAAVSGNTRAAMDLSLRLQELARNAEDGTLSVEANYGLGITYYWRGDWTEAVHYLDAGLATYSEADHTHYLAHYGQDPGVICGCRAAVARWYLGQMEQAALQMQDADDLAHRLGNPFSIGYMMNWRAIHAFEDGDADTARQAAYDNLRFAEEQGFADYRAMGLVNLARYLSEYGEPDDALAASEQALDVVRETGTHCVTPLALGLVGDALRRTGQPEAGLARTAEAAALMVENGACWAEVDVLRAAAGCNLACGQRAESFATLDRALGVARHQNARLLELRVLADVVDWSGTDDSSGPARARLAKQLAAIKGGDHLRDVKRARALIGAAGE